ncbi:MAG: class II fructose-bisphosphate aldolase [Dorea sp.]|nr:class II fructose-bisphosphate aldolase [Dorea sp.]
MLTNFNSMLKSAYGQKRAVGSFNFYNYETLKGILQAAEQMHTPVIVSFGKKYLANMSFDEVQALTAASAALCKTDVCLHLDHCDNMDIIYQAIRAGFTSVMYDGSALPFEENAANTRRICEVAHASGVSVEAELGSLAAGASSHEGSADDVEVYTNPDAAHEFVQKTGVDALAVSIGTVHGLYKGTPNIRVDILKAINAKLHIPLVLHGGSGTPEEKVKECISNGIAKINVNTEISDYTVQRTRELLEKENPHLSVAALNQMQYVAEIVQKYMGIFENV